MEAVLLSEKNQFPTQEIIFSHIGTSKPFWQHLFKQVHSHYPDFTEQWRYYNDGKSWLLKVTHKSKTIFWLSVLQDTFRITFYFADKAEEVLMASEISEELKIQFKNGKRYGKIRAITLTINSNKEIENILILIKIKLSIK